MPSKDTSPSTELHVPVRIMPLGRKPGVTWMLSSLLLSGLTSVASAQQEFHLGEILVTGRKGSHTGAHEAQISLETIRRFNFETAGEALSLVPGLQISRVGPRNEQMIQMRGYDLRQVPVFVDGVPVYVPYDGYVDLGRFNTFDLARIDVSKGFSALSHGANAVGGTINLITRRPQQGLEGDVGVMMMADSRGHGNGERAYLNLGGATERWYFQAGASYLNNDDFRLPGGFVADDGITSGIRDNSGNRDRKLNLKVAYTPNETDEYALAYINQQGEKGNPVYAGNVPGIQRRFWQWPWWDKESLYFISRTRFNESELTTRVYHDTYANALHSYDDDSYTTQTRPFAFRSLYDDYTNGASIQLSQPLGTVHTLRGSMHWKEDVHREANVGDPWARSRDITRSFTLEDTIVVTESLSLVLGAAHEERRALQAQNFDSGREQMEEFPRGVNSLTSAQGALFHTLGNGDGLHASVARRGRFATIKDRYSFRFGTAIPNPDLGAEMALHYEVGYSRSEDKWGEFQISLFRSDATDMIQMVRINPEACQSPPCSQMQNIGEVRAQGAEVSFLLPFDHFQLGGNYTYLNRDNVSNPEIILINTSRHNGSLFAIWQPTADWELSALTQASSFRHTASDGRQPTAGFGVANAKARYQVNADLRVELGVDNLLDRAYQIAEGFPEQGRTWYVQANWTF